MASYILPRALCATLVRITLWTAALASIAASAYLGFAYGYQFGLAFGVIAVAAEVFKPVALHLGLTYLADWRRLYLVPILLGFAFVCMAYSLLAELGLAALTRGDHVAERGARARDAQQNQEERQRATVELQDLSARPLVEMEALVKAARPRCYIHISHGRRETVCIKDPKLLAEYARAKRRAELEAKIAALPAAAPITAADPLADVLALLYHDTTGRTVDVPALSKRLYLSVVLLIEMCSTFGVLVAKLASDAMAGQMRPVATTVAPKISVAAPVSGSVARNRSATEQKSDAQRDLLAYIAKCGHIPSQDFLACRWRVNKGTVSRWVQDWEKQRLITRYRDGKCKVVLQPCN